MDFIVLGKGKLMMKFEGEDGKVQEYDIFNFKGAGIVMGMYNTDESIIGFVHFCFNQVLSKKWFLYFLIKNTIFKKYDGRFKDIFEEIYQKDYKVKFEVIGIVYEHCLIDDMVASALKWNGNFVWVCKNYDGDVQFDFVVYFEFKSFGKFYVFYWLVFVLFGMAFFISGSGEEVCGCRL